MSPIRPRRVVSSEAALDEARRAAKLQACPHCGRVGTLIGHGVLLGYSERSEERVVRGRRLFCSNRNRRPGCGRTVSVWLDTVIAGFVVRTRTLSPFVGEIMAGKTRKAAWERAACGAFSLASGYRLWQRLVHAQPELRTRLSGVAAAPPCTSKLPWAQLLANEACFERSRLRLRQLSELVSGSAVRLKRSGLSRGRERQRSPKCRCSAVRSWACQRPPTTDVNPSLTRGAVASLSLQPTAPKETTMKRISPYLKMRVLGAIEFAPGNSIVERIRHVSTIVFTDDDNEPYQFTWRTIQTWYSRYKKDGITQMLPKPRSDRGRLRKVEPELVQDAIEQVLPDFHEEPRNIASVYRRCIERGLLRREQVAPNTFRRVVNRYELLKPETASEDKKRLAFAKAHANELWQADTMMGPTSNTATGTLRPSSSPSSTMPAVSVVTANSSSPKTPTPCSRR